VERPILSQKEKKREEIRKKDNAGGVEELSEEELHNRIQSIEQDLKETISRDPTPAVTSPRVIQTQVQPKEEPKEKLISPEIRQILPDWVEKPWRWITPEELHLKEQWLVEWGDFLMEWSRTKELHIIKKEDVRREFPFKQPLLKKQLSTEQFERIGDNLTERQKAKRWDAKKRRLRVYWMPLEDVAEEIFEWAEDQGLLIATIFDLQNSRETWSKVPRRELLLVLQRLVKTKRANWADKEKTSISFIYDF